MSKPLQWHRGRPALPASPSRSVPARSSLPLTPRHPVARLFPTCSASPPVIITLGPSDPARSTIMLSETHRVLLTFRQVGYFISSPHSPRGPVLVVVVRLRFRGGNRGSGRSGSSPEVTQLFGGRAGARSLVPPCCRCACCPDLRVCAVPLPLAGGLPPSPPIGSSLLCVPVMPRVAQSSTLTGPCLHALLACVPLFRPSPHTGLFAITSISLTSDPQGQKPDLLVLCAPAPDP